MNNRVQNYIVNALFFCLLAFFPTQAHANEPTGEDVVLASIILGLNAETLACLDVHGSEVTTVLDRLQSQYDEFELFCSSSVSQSEALALIRSHEATLRFDPSNANATEQRQLAISAANSAASSMTAYRSSLILDLLDGLGDTNLVNQALFANGRINQLPAAYRLAVDTESGADRLRWALDMDARADAGNTTPPAAAQSELATANVQSDVQLAKARATAYTNPNQTSIDLWLLAH